MMFVTRKQFLILVSLLCAVPFICGQEISLPCGYQKEKINRLIHRGNDTLAGQWPWHVALFNKTDYQCGGSIIDQNTILTAAHCVHTSVGVVSVTHVSVHVGRVNLNKTNEHTKIYNVSKIIVHHEYSDNSVNHDIALLMLTSNITINNYVQPVCLWTMDSKQELIVNKTGTIVGFGYDEGDVVSDQLKQAAIEVMDPLTCIASDRIFFGLLLTPDVFCGIGKTGVSACNGDSGGGMFFEEKGKWFLRGLVSYASARANPARRLCDPLKPTVYVDVAKYMDWIKQHIDPRVLWYENEFQIDYEEKLRLFNFQTCGIKSSTYTKTFLTWTQPWIGFVVQTNQENKLCALTLISEWYAVGPAHCVENIGVNSTVFFGGFEHDPNGTCLVEDGVKYCSQATQTHQIQKVTNHLKSDDIAHDLALIEFMTAVDIHQPNVQPICMPLMPFLRANASTNLYVATIDFYKGSINNIPVRYMESDECMGPYAQGNVTRSLKYNQICAEQMNSEDEESCWSSFNGSPLHEMKLLNDTERYFIRGLDLFGLTCFAKKPTVYLNADPYIDWILYHMRYHTLKGTNASVNSSVNLSLESEWSMLQQQPGKEKLSLFNMDTCGTASEVIQPDDHLPWIGIAFATSGSFTKTATVVLINEWYVLAPRDIVQTKTDSNVILLGKQKKVKKRKPTYQHVNIKNIIEPHPDHPRQTFALIELLEPADLKNPYIRPICLPFMETLHHINSTELVLTTAEAYENRINPKSKNVTLIDLRACQDKLLWISHFLSNEHSSCATESLRGTHLLADDGNPFQMRVQFGNQQRYFLYGMNANRRDDFLRGYYGTYLIDKIELADLEWIVENMQQKERPTTTSNERVNLEKVQVSKSRENLFDFSSCGKSSTSYPAPWIERFVCSLNLTYDPINER